jgi:hypothetical protein
MCRPIIGILGQEQAPLVEMSRLVPFYHMPLSSLPDIFRDSIGLSTSSHSWYPTRLI